MGDGIPGLVPPLTEDKLEFYRGRHFSTSFTLVANQEGATLDEAEIFFTVKENECDEEPVLQATIGDGLSLEGDLTIKLDLDPEDTKLFKLRFYFYELQVIEAEGRNTVAKKGVLSVRGVINTEN